VNIVLLFLFMLMGMDLVPALLFAILFAGSCS
jgi:hypothetical protein